MTCLPCQNLKARTTKRRPVAAFHNPERDPVPRRGRKGRRIVVVVRWVPPRTKHPTWYAAVVYPTPSSATVETFVYSGRATKLGSKSHWTPIKESAIPSRSYAKLRARVVAAAKKQKQR